MKGRYRADHVGSLLRPANLLDARRKFHLNEISKDQLVRLEDQAIIEVLEKQNAAGLAVRTDGEYRRAAWSSAWAESVEGLAQDDVETSPAHRLASLSGWKGEHGAEANASMVRHTESGEFRYGQFVSRKLKLRQRLTGHEFAFLRKNASGPVKMTMPGVMMTAASWYHPEKTKAAYPARSLLVDDMVAIVRKEIQQLIAEGIDYVQLDSLRYMWFFDPQLRKSMRDRGANLHRELEEAIASDNACIEGIVGGPATLGLHICRGNNTSAWLAEGGYDSVAERAFSELKVDRLLLEYDTDRAGGFEPLRFVRKGMMVVLGLVSSKTPNLESKDALRRRVDEAAKYVALEDLALSPQCGFASSSSGNLMTLDEQQRKLELVVETARSIWSD